MIGVIAEAGARVAVEEFFQLFKTPWEFFRAGRRYDAVIATTPDVPEVDARLLLVFGSRSISFDGRHGIIPVATVERPMLECRGRTLPLYGSALILSAASGTPCISCAEGGAGISLRPGMRQVIRLGYDLFEEIRFLLVEGQPVERARFPALDLHIALIRDWLVEAGIAFVEIPPIPGGHRFAVCLTHDIDFFGIRRHRLDHTMWGFLYRATFGALRSYGRGRIGFARLVASLRSAASLPLVYLGWARDFWLPFEWYLHAERGLASTYYLIPFRARPGDKVPGSNPQRRGCAYDVEELTDWIETLRRGGHEVGVHGIDAWHSASLGVEERKRIQALTADSNVGIRMHWLLSDHQTCTVLEQSGFAYDSTAGYNETPGYRNGTGQVFLPPGCRALLELPLHIQDGALFLPKRLNLSDAEAWEVCQAFIRDAGERGGVLTILWHDRSHASERFWGDFYLRLLQALAGKEAWFGTAAQVVDWFRRRRDVTFRRSEADAGATWLESSGPRIDPPLLVRVHRPGDGHDGAASSRGFADRPWNGGDRLELDPMLHGTPPSSSASPLRVH